MSSDSAPRPDKATIGIPPRSYRQRCLVVSGILLGAAILRSIGLFRQRLTFDEVITATIAIQPFFDSVVSQLRFDIHPPLYYLQLHFWALLGQSDVWLILNSVVWSLAALVSLYLTVKRVFGERVAIGALLVLASMPLAVQHAQTLRMYSMLMVLTTWAWFFMHRYVAWDGHHGKDLAKATLMQLLIVYSHGTGILIAAYLATYGLLASRDRPSNRLVRRKFLFAQVFAALLAIPAVVNSIARSVTHGQAPGVVEIEATLVSLLFGEIKAPSIIAGLVAVAVFAYLAIAAVRQTPVRAITWSLIFIPMATNLLLSYAGKPIWHLRTFVFLLPFIALALAYSVLSSGENRARRSGWAWCRYLFSSVLIGAMVTASIDHALTSEKPNDFRGVASDIAQDLQPGDVIYAPKWVHFWGVARYLIGPDWGSPLEVQDPIMTDRWRRILDALGPIWSQRLKLEPITRRVTYQGVPLIIGESDARLVAEEAHRVFLVSNYTTRNAPVAFDNFSIEETRDYHGVVVIVLQRRM